MAMEIQVLVWDIKKMWEGWTDWWNSEQSLFNFFFYMSCVNIKQSHVLFKKYVICII